MSGTKHKNIKSIFFFFNHALLTMHIIKVVVVLPEHDINWPKPVLVKKPKLMGYQKGSPGP